MAVRKAAGLLAGGQVERTPGDLLVHGEAAPARPADRSTRTSREQRLSKKLALGVLSPDGISSSAYGTEEILIELMPIFGLAAFACSSR